MKWTFKFIDIYKTRQSLDHWPEDFISRKDADEWVYLDGPLIMEGPSSDQPWRRVASGDAVRVPLVPYCTSSRDPAVAMAHAFQLGARAFMDWGSDYVAHVHLSVGAPVEEIDNYLPIKRDTKVSCFRYWIGLAIKVRSK